MHSRGCVHRARKRVSIVLQVSRVLVHAREQVNLRLWVSDACAAGLRVWFSERCMRGRASTLYCSHLMHQAVPLWIKKGFKKE